MEPAAAYATRMKDLPVEQEVLALLAALDPGRVDTTFRAGDQVMLWTKELLYAAEVSAAGGPLSSGCTRGP